MKDKIYYLSFVVLVVLLIGCTEKLYEKTIKGHYKIFQSIVESNNDSSIIFGRISDERDQLPIPYSWIKIDGTEIGVSADSLGNYSLIIPSGKYKFVATSASNSEFKTKHIKVAPNSKIRIDFYLGSHQIY